MADRESAAPGADASEHGKGPTDERRDESDAGAKEGTAITTIAWDGRYLAADRQMTHGDGRKRIVRKIHEAVAYFCAGTGDPTDWEFIREWLASGMKPADRPKLEDSCSGFVVEKVTKHLYHVQGKSPVLHRLYDKIHAAGTGADYALAAMRLGKIAADAVLIAHEFDAYTGADVDVVDLDAPPIGPT